MAAGGFLYARETITPSEEAKSSSYIWGKEIHLARCKAFLRATLRCSQTWSCIEVPTGGGIQRVLDEIIEVNGNSFTIHIQDYNRTGNASSFVGFVSVLKYETKEYMIITSEHTNTSGYSDYGIKTGTNKKIYSNTNSYYVTGCGHAYATNGFYSYDLNESNELKEGELCPMSCYSMGTTGNSDTSSFVRQYTSSYNFTFGYLIKGNVIFSMAYCSKWDSNHFPCKWCLIGEIFDSTVEHPYGALIPIQGNENGGSTNPTNWISYSSCAPVQVLNYNNKCMPNKSGPVWGSAYPSYFGTEFRTEYTGEMKFGALLVGITNLNNNISNIDPVRENGEGMKGFINTDILRVIPGQRCSSDGSLLNNGNFITLSIGTTGSAGSLGICIGWDPSNPSLY